MENVVLQYFGRKLIERGRDGSMESFEILIKNALEGKTSAKQFQELLNSLNSKQQEDLSKLMLYMIDTVIHNILFMFEEYTNIHISVEYQDQILKDLRDVAGGGLQGYAFIWAEEFSKKLLSDE